MDMPMKQGMGPQGAPPAGPEAAPAPGGQGGANPVTDAIKTIAEFAMAQKKAGNPQAEAIIEAIKGLIMSMKSEGGAPAPEAPAPMSGPVSISRTCAINHIAQVLLIADLVDVQWLVVVIPVMV